MDVASACVYQTQQIRELERLASERFGIAGDVLMSRAGKAALDFMLLRWGHTKRLAVFCGGGNNGGDGYVLAELARQRGLHVTIFQVGDHSHLQGSAKSAFERCQQAGVPVEAFQAHSDIHHPDLIIDAICGIGIEQVLREEVVMAITAMQRAEVPILALDTPTGIHADTGEVLGEAIHATATITFIGLKLGLLTGKGSSYTGELVVNDLQLPADLFSCVTPVAETIQLNDYQQYLKPRLRDWHKRLSGHVLVVGGAQGLSGAARMAGMAALRVGAGLVSIATDEISAPLMNIECPELMCHGIKNAKALQPLLQAASVVIVGPGLQQSDWAKALWAEVMATNKPMVVDADGLNLLAEHPQRHDNWVLTPHPGEAARLLGRATAAIQQNRLAAATDIISQYGGVAVLKGSGTLVITPSTLPAVCDKGNPGMATAGMGDVLSGVIGGLVAQGAPLDVAARLGVALHAMAGDLAAKDGERGMIATDLLPYLRRLCNLTP